MVDLSFVISFKLCSFKLLANFIKSRQSLGNMPQATALGIFWPHKIVIFHKK